MKSVTRNSIVAIATLVLTACTARSGSTPSSDANGAPNSPTPAAATALPTSWYATPDAGKAAADPIAPLEPVGAQADHAVGTVFDATVGALPASRQNDQAQSQALPSDRVPWHLDGMVADFAVATNGIFGALLGGGTASVKVTWQQQTLPVPVPIPAAPPHGKSIRLNSKMTQVEVAREFEPAIRSAVQTGAVQNESALRTNLLSRALRFQDLGRALLGIHLVSGWHVDGLQLQLTVDSQGQITPVLGVGGAVNFYVDWQNSGDGPVHPDTVANQTLQRNLSQFANLIAQEVPLAVQETRNLQKDFEKLGVVFDQFQVGLGVTAAGNVGVAKSSAELQGKLIFKKDAGPAVTPAAVSETIGSGYLSVVNAPSRAGDSVQRIDAKQFRNGLKRALHMAGYFADKAMQANISGWKVSQIETEFDLSLGGALKLATVTGTGQFVLDFDQESQ